MRADKLLPVVEETVALKPRAIWLQLGIINEDAKRLAEDNNIAFFMNVCVKQEHTKLFGNKPA